MRSVQHLVRYAPKISQFLVVVTVLVLLQPKFLIRMLRFLSLARSSRDRCCNIEFRVFLCPEYSLHKRAELFPSITDSLVMLKCPISTVLANSSCSASRLCLCLLFFCEIDVNCSGSRSISSSSADLVGASISFSVSHHCIRLPASMVLIKSSCSQVLPYGVVAGHIGCEVWTLECVNHLQCYTVQLSLVFVGISVPPRLFGRGLQQAPVLWLDLCRKCCHFFGIPQTGFCIAFLCPINVVEHRNAVLKCFWIPSVRVRPEYVS